ncbi:MAG: BNR repeat-containing protein [Melioribacteraceae bacterium]|nr:BNR repeat-containing protein [Melioribacteraceae bacterium]
MHEKAPYLFFVLFFLRISVCGQQLITFSKISENSGIQTDRRPISVAFYDSISNKTFLSWMGGYSHPLVKSYDHATTAWSEDKIIGTSPFADAHNYPGMIQAKNGKLIMFYGCHNSVMKISTSPVAGSIEGDWDDRELVEAQGASYPVPIILADGTIYCFYRVTMRTVFPSEKFPVDYRPLAFVKSTDNGETWSRSVIIIDNYPRTDNLNEIYLGKIAYQPKSDSVSERFHIAWSIAGGGPDVHDHGNYRRHVYYSYFQPQNDLLFDINGNELGISIDNAEAEQYCKVMYTGTPPEGDYVGYQVSTHFCDDGFPVIVFRHDEAFKCAYRSGTEWKISDVYESSNEPRDIEKIGSKSFRTFRTSGKSLYSFVTENGGENWKLESKITSPIFLQRNYIIQNYKDGLKHLFTEGESGGSHVGEGKFDIYVGTVDEVTSVNKKHLDFENTFRIFPNYPNPFNPNTNIRYFVQQSGRVKLEVFDSMGSRFQILKDGFHAKGEYTVSFDGSGLSSGIYYLRSTFMDKVLVQKMVLIR